MIVAFSGASHSGKTTFAHNLRLYAPPGEVICYDEIIRNERDGAYPLTQSIDKLRQDPYKYFDVQKKIIKKKLLQEADADFNPDLKNKFVIFDRSLVDSLYYCMFYVQKNVDPHFDWQYMDFLIDLHSKVKLEFKYVYDKIFLFTPIYSKEVQDSWRPELLQWTQPWEYKIIKSLTYGIAQEMDCLYKIVEIDVTKTSVEEFYDEHVSYLQST